MDALELVKQGQIIKTLKDLDENLSNACTQIRDMLDNIEEQIYISRRLYKFLEHEECL